MLKLKFAMLTIFAILLSVPLTYAANTASSDLEQLLFMEIPSVSSASKFEQSLTEAPSVISVVTKEEIKKFGANNLHDVLDRVTSLVTIGQYLNVDGNSSIRGDLFFGQDLHVLILLNGRPLRDGIGGYNLGVYEAFPLDAIDSIEVVRGPGSVLYESNAYVGVINIKTKKSKMTEGLRASARLGGGSFGTGLGSVATDVKAGDLEVSAAVSALNSKGWSFTATDENRVTNSVDYAKASVGLNTLVGYKNFSFNIFASTLEDTVMGLISQWNADGTTVAFRNQWLFADAGYKLDIADSWYAQFDLGYTYTYINFTNVVPDTTHRSISCLGEATLFGKLTDGLNLIAGGVFEKRMIPAGALMQPADQNNVGLYLQMDYQPIRALKLTAGVQDNSTPGQAPGIVPRAGAVWNVNDKLGCKLLYGEAFRSACLMEMYIPTPILVGNPQLEPERIATTDAQVFYQDNQFQGTLTYFNSRYTNMVIRNTAAFPQTYMNGSGMTVNGVELEGKAPILANLKMTGSYTYQKNKDNDGIEDYMQISNHIAKLGLIYDVLPDLTIGVFDSYFSKPADVSNVSPTRLLVNNEPNAYNWMTLNIDYKVMKHFAINAYVTNVLNAEVFYPEFGRKRINSLPGKPGTGAYLKAEITL